MLLNLPWWAYALGGVAIYLALLLGGLVLCNLTS